jgi:hypothetical protein
LLEVQVEVEGEGKRKRNRRGKRGGTGRETQALKE